MITVRARSVIYARDFAASHPPVPLHPKPFPGLSQVTSRLRSRIPLGDPVNRAIAWDAVSRTHPSQQQDGVEVCREFYNLNQSSLAEIVDAGATVITFLGDFPVK